MYPKLSLKENLLKALLLACLCWLTSCTCSNEYELIISRSDGALNEDSNDLTLYCRCDLQDSPDLPFWLNDTEADIKQKLGVGNYTEPQNGLSFKITRGLEGKYFCGPASNTSPQVSLVAYPLPDERVESARITAVAGRDAVLTPLISPGALIQQYFIDWQDTTSSATLAHIQGPRSQQQVVSNERYSIDPQTFELTISSVRFKDRGSYLGLIGVIDPKGQQFTYEHTQQKSITLDVYVSPTFLKHPLEKPVVNSSSTTFSCKVQGYPQPTITWNHDGVDATTKPNEYRIEEIVSTGPPFIVESNLTIMALQSEDSGNLTCVAVVTTNEGKNLEDRRTSYVSILGSLTEVRTYVTLSRGVILKVYLAEALAAEVQLFVRYTNTESGESRNLTSVSYVQSKEIVFFDENIPYDKFTVEVALMSDSLMGPLYQDHRMHDRNKPTEIFLLVTRYILPTCAGLLVVVIVTIIIITCLCRKTCLQCCTKINRQGTVLIVVEKKVDLPLEDLRSQLSDEKDVLGGPPPHPNIQQTNLWKKIISYLYCSETREEREAREKVTEIKRLLGQNRPEEERNNGNAEDRV